jgi:MFS family permease
MTVVLIGLLLAPLVAGWICVRVTRSRGKQAWIAWVLGVAILVFASWLGGRADEYPIEGVLAGFWLTLSLYAAWRLRRTNRPQAG